jgi:hypothetical protein
MHPTGLRVRGDSSAASQIRSNLSGSIEMRGYKTRLLMVLTVLASMALVSGAGIKWL